MSTKRIDEIMAREIKFRGKAINGEWRYGLLAMDKRGSFISNSVGKPFAYHVRPESVGQFTGMKDDKGAEIYEGDLLEICNHMGVSGPVEVRDIFDFAIWWDTTVARDGYSLYVVGNIHDRQGAGNE